MAIGEGSRAPAAFEAAQRAVAAIGCGYDIAIAADVRLTRCKSGRLIELDGATVEDTVVPGGVVLRGVPKSIRCDKGERTRFHSEVLSFHQMSEQFNQEMSLSGKIPSGLFNAMFDYRGCWKKDASSTKWLCFDGWFITLYSIELERSNLMLLERVKNDVPTSWDPAALAEFIDKYGTHIIFGVKMGGKDVIHIKQLEESVLQQNEVQNLLKKLADEKFAEESHISDELSSRKENNELVYLERNAALFNSLRSTVLSHSKKDDIVSIQVRRGGINTNQSHSQWLSTISDAPDVISMSFIPIVSLLNGVRGSGFLTHAINLYLRHKPPIEELAQFLEFQLPRQWAPAFGELPLGPQHRKRTLPSLQFTFLGPKLHVNNIQVDSGRRPVTGIRLYLEGRRNDRLAIHLQHLSALPTIFKLYDDEVHVTEDLHTNQRAYFEPIRWALLSHICTAPVQYSGAHLDESASIVTKAWLEVKEMGFRRVLFLRLGFSHVASMRLRRSEWDGPSSISRKSGSISAFISSRFSMGILPTPKPKVEVNSAVFPGGPPTPVRVPKLARFVDTSEISRGPDDLPGYWVVSGAKLCVEGGKISLKVKYSLLVFIRDDDL
ncbi:MACPF domain-containing protein NSL1-like [Phalaenopsis equestris]|uniref:MACPF domain-containing protein NSL1-like n=1 Tax=Phalaenopsis equestris TaxID=78828 RepID=UPI0009E4B27B|nr:MACPF domain-containing protein NSL1-like [Phalaenopsis equestris]